MAIKAIQMQTVARVQVQQQRFSSLVMERGCQWVCWTTTGVAATVVGWVLIVVVCSCLEILQ
jgi:hypothetical protein